ncbi:MAG: AMP-binding protein [Candidatus Endonucleobacter bathymodioli]|uniref:AMP-binding protein n=1 Tax=Candidatus Endonucleibacter bathymodioli TaxID=539814 RepID=A0AA90NM84_9GAMM|nr:AMP-binding protein [Candidatus Endonucleobacter bathymodioli]
MSKEQSTFPLIPFEKSFAQSLLKSAKKHSLRPALWVDNKTYSYSTLMTDSLVIAATLQALAINPERCGILAYRSAVIYQSIWGALLAGCCYVPLNPRFPPGKNHPVLVAADCSVVIVDRRSEAAACELLLRLDKGISVLLPEHSKLPDWCQGTQHHYICQNQMATAKDWQKPDMVNPYAYLLFTSGTTGQPKGIAVNHQNMKAYISNILENYTLSATDRFSQISDLTFDLSVHDIGCTWTVGGALYVPPESALLCPADFVSRHELTCWSSVPSLLGFMDKFRKIKKDGFPHLRYSFFSGEAMPALMAAKWDQATPNGKIVNIYGPTEATVSVTSCVYRSMHLELASLPIGKPFSQQETIVVNDKNELIKGEDHGELWLGGSQVTDGYWRDSARTQQSFIEKTFINCVSKRWYRTGDIVSWHKSYGLMFHGRKDFQVKINGFRVELSEVEAVIRTGFSCSWVAVIPWPVDSAGAAKGLVAWLSGLHGSTHAVRQHCIEQLPPYMVPGYVFWQTELPRNTNGKVDIKALQQLTQEQTRVLKK